MLGRGVAADDVHLVERVAVGVAVLDEQAAEDTPEIALARHEAAPLAVDEHPRRLFSPSASRALGVEARREQDLDELLRERASEAVADGPVEDDDTAVRRDRVRRESPVVRLVDRRAQADAARDSRA